MSKKRSVFATQVVSDAKRSHKKSGYLKLPEGIKKFEIAEDTRKLRLDFLPYEVTSEKHPDRDNDQKRAIPGSLWYKLPFKTHRGVGADSSTVVCLRSFGKKCPICEAVEARLKKGAEWDDVKEIAAKERNLYVVVPIDSEKFDEVPHIWDMSQFLFQDLLNDTLKEDEDMGIFPDLEEGKTLELKFRWKKFGKRKFPETTDITFHDRDPYKEKIMKDVPSLDEVLIVHTYGELQEMFFSLGDEPEADVDDSDDDTPVRSKKSARDDDDDEKEEKKTSRKRKDDDEEDDDSPRSKKAKKEEDEEEEDEKPAKKRSSRDEDDEDDEPKRSKKKPAKEPDEDEEEDLSSKRGKKTSKSDDDDDEDDEKEAPAGKCPKKHKFGVDTDKFDDCDECPIKVWTKCDEAKRANKKK
jgi:hypothetical protein